MHGSPHLAAHPSTRCDWIVRRCDFHAGTAGDASDVDVDVDVDAPLGMWICGLLRHGPGYWVGLWGRLTIMVELGG
jgi:hypothetical protein